MTHDASVISVVCCTSHIGAHMAVLDKAATAVFSKTYQSAAMMVSVTDATYNLKVFDGGVVDAAERSRTLITIRDAHVERVSLAVEDATEAVGWGSIVARRHRAAHGAHRALVGRHRNGFVSIAVATCES